MSSAIELFQRPIARLPAVLLVTAAVMIALVLLPRAALGFQLSVAIDGPTSFVAGNDVPFVVTLQLDLDELFGASVTADLAGPEGFSRTIAGIPVGPDGLSFGPIQSSTPTTDVSMSGDITHASVAANVFTGYGDGYQGLVANASMTIDGTLSLPADAPSGEYTLAFTVDNGSLPGSHETASVILTIRPSLITALPEGWSTYSIPIAAENGKFFATADLGNGAQDGLVDPNKVTTAFRFDAATETFKRIVTTVTNAALEVANSVPLQPTEAVLVNSNASHNATLIFEDAQTNLPSRTLSATWNLVGLAVPLGMTTMQVDEALISVGKATGDLTGYTIVVSPAINPDPFVWTPLESPAGYVLTRSHGYWVSMQNQGILAGFSTTPVDP